jgi:serine/threonine protein kinase
MEKYHLIDRVGEGTFGVVHKAKDVETGKVVALKKISKNEVTIAQYIGIKPNEMEEFPKNALREAKTLQHVEHQNVNSL